MSRVVFDGGSTALFVHPCNLCSCTCCEVSPCSGFGVYLVVGIRFTSCFFSVFFSKLFFFNINQPRFPFYSIHFIIATKKFQYLYKIFRNSSISLFYYVSSLIIVQVSAEFYILVLADYKT